MILKPCPFCGGAAEVERSGDSRRSTIYSCTECGCSLETGETFNHGVRWNRREGDPVTEFVVNEHKIIDMCRGVVDVGADTTSGVSAVGATIECLTRQRDEVGIQLVALRKEYAKAMVVVKAARALDLQLVADEEIVLADALEAMSIKESR